MRVGFWVFFPSRDKALPSFPNLSLTPCVGSSPGPEGTAGSQDPQTIVFRPFYGDKTRSLPVLQSSPRLRRLFPVACGHARIESSETIRDFPRFSAALPGRIRAGVAQSRPGARGPSLGQSRLKEAEIKTKLVKKKLNIYR